MSLVYVKTCVRMWEGSGGETVGAGGQDQHGGGGEFLHFWGVWIFYKSLISVTCKILKKRNAISYKMFMGHSLWQKKKCLKCSWEWKMTKLRNCCKWQLWECIVDGKCVWCGLQKKITKAPRWLRGRHKFLWGWKLEGNTAPSAVGKNILP